MDRLDPTRPFLVRLPLEDEEDAYVELARQAVAESARHVGFNPERVRETFHRYLAEADPTILVVERKRELVGFLNATMSSYTFADGLYTTQEVLFVRPDCRGTWAATALLEAFVSWSDSLGAVEITGGNDNGLLTEQTARLLERHGFQRVGVFMRRVRKQAHG
ncbi:GNAT family N-acetyltransferase [Salinarimonas soli]|uniref:GNAT family N-acetyltransferase n=1 Tax=Salinarimonas soli TaxID=1638099 RepID=A0A5B2VAW7_9HYPH|nr:GNAT family N-acetyltransferase [Salinarimonas soli]KAA2235580.1 GNAT family N-acetyltransferase [Salinarimonas soli]